MGNRYCNWGDLGSLVVEGYRTGLPAGEYRVHVRLQEDGAMIACLLNCIKNIAIDDQGKLLAANFSSISLPD